MTNTTDDAVDETPDREGGDPSSADGDADAGTDPAICETLEIATRPQVPNVLIVLDRSGSMAGEPWDHAIASLDLLLERYPTYRFGLAMYPSVGEELACLGGDVVVDPGEGTHETIRDTLFAEPSRAIKDNGYTPTAATLEIARTALAPLPDDTHERYVLLVTDGQPNCNLAGPEKHTPDVDATLSALDALLADGTKTFVVGYKTGEYVDIMNQMAAHGGTTQHYPVEDETGLVEAFGTIAGNLAPCAFELDDAPRGPEYVRVLLDGKDLSFGDGGFTLEDDSTVRLSGSSCGTMRDGATHTLSVTVECEPVRVL